MPSGMLFYHLFLCKIYYIIISLHFVHMKVTSKNNFERYFFSISNWCYEVVCNRLPDAVVLTDYLPRWILLRVLGIPCNRVCDTVILPTEERPVSIMSIAIYRASTDVPVVQARWLEWVKHGRGGEEPMNLNVKNGVEKASAIPLMLVVSMCRVYSTIRRTCATSHWMVVLDPAQRNS